MLGQVYDRRGCPVYGGDVLKVYHFIGARRKRYYMYKVVAEVEGFLYAVCASSIGRKGLADAHSCRLPLLNEESFEVVQGYGPGDTVSYEDRPHHTRKPK